MPAPRKVDLLPAEVREELNRRIVEGGFGGYVDLSDWLSGQGYEIGKSTIATHGKELQRRIEAIKVATEQAEALLAESPDDAGSISEAALRIAQQRMFDVFLASEEGDLKAMGTAMTALAKASRAGIAIRAERRKVLIETKAAVAERLDAAERDAGAGADPRETLRRVRQEIYGIFDD